MGSKQFTGIGEGSTGNNEQEALPGLYIHVPFCKTKCSYCDFYSVTDGSLISDWVAAVKQEIQLYRACFTSFDSVYLGGGTPSLLREQHIEDLLEAILSSFTVRSGSEFTLEANPDDVTLEKARSYRYLGINRISLGVQSFHDAELSSLERRHTAGQSKRALEVARAAGFTNLGIDLMYGLEGQTEAAWVETLETALTFSPEHLSCYQLTIEHNTPSGRRLRGRRLQPTGEEGQRSFFLLTSSFLESHGYVHYEISNFARSESLLCRHNQKYWDRTPYLGLGPAAHSFKENKRWWNVRSVDRYCDMLRRKTAPVEDTEVLSPEQRFLESLFLGFRTAGGLDVSLVTHHPRAERILKDLQHNDLIRINDGRVRPTREGLLVADSLPLLFIDR